MALTVFLQGAFLLFLLYLGARLLRPRKVSRGEPPAFFSVIIPFKNEANNLYALLSSLAEQRCSIPYEIILVNDHSNDAYETVLTEIRGAFAEIPLRVYHAPDPSEECTSKQNAMEYGVAFAEGDWLIFTDADMVFFPSWLEQYYAACCEKKSDFFFGRTAMVVSKNIFSCLQATQLDLLFVSAWILARAGFDSSCMGNNMAIRKTVYDELGGQPGLGYSMVEDKKLMTVLRRRGYGISPTPNFSSCAYTYPEKSMKGMYLQLLRWFKGGGKESPFLCGLGVLLLSNMGVTLYGFVSGDLYFPILHGAVWAVLLFLYFYAVVVTKIHLSIPNLLIYILCFPVICLCLGCSMPFTGVVWKGEKVS
ncbi:glycosyltransferase [Chitinivibrio alkaliphilus]|uniref:Glycosyl transferase family 2 n=1 Tax=Chitinivibrio alkaliphilus ACht1 TaxID=1313304 RepID=U7DCI6_9BACT|nr:glycosyltransferase [Chitinivibrio alkaliphilus]ERP39268.1 glycosyl transferase family 2 [Chitinivibrio alkaliphilus ACht1]